MHGSTQQKPNKFGRAYEAAKTSSVGIELVVSIVIGFAAGHWADGQLSTGPFLTIALTACGLAAGVRALVRTTREARRQFAEIDAVQSEDAEGTAGGG